MKNNLYRVTLKMQSVQTKVRTTVTNQLENASVTSLIFLLRIFVWHTICSVHALDIKHILMKFQ